MLSLGVGALQLMLDRGADADWFSSVEIWIELGLAITGFWVFIVHMLTAEHPFIDPKIFLDRNFATGLVFIFVIGVILLASLALLPPMLSTIFGYPTITTGLVMAPRGVGTMISMLIVGRIVRIVDARILVVVGLLLTAQSLYTMSGFSPQMDSWLIISSGVVQGLGLGLVFVPLSTVAFATLEARYRTDATALFSLVRNIGSSIGISMMIATLTSKTTLMHERLGANVTPFNDALQFPDVAQTLNLGSESGKAMLDGIITQQAALIAYLNDFKLLMYLTLAVIPLIFIIGRSRRAMAPTGGGHDDEPMVMD
jgi:DHA2 family multidrug resistance protein